MATERLKIRLPDGFDPARHLSALLKQIADTHGEGWEVDSVDPEAGVAHAFRQVTLTEVTASERGKRFEVRLAIGTKPADGDRVATRLEDLHPGYVLAEFDPYLGRAVLSKLTDAEQRCRGAVSVALGTKPWEVQVSARLDGGFDLVLPKTYVPSKHDKKLEEVATAVVGREGWYVDTDPGKLTASIIPADPPTFPPVVPYPIKRLTKSDPMAVRFGVRLPAPGSDDLEEVTLDWAASSWAMVAGTPGSGKSVALNAIIAGSLASGSELVIVDDQSKAVDFLWCKSFVRPGGWGCDGLTSSVAALGLVYEEGKQRAKQLAQEGVVNWPELPASKRPAPILVVVDEVTALLSLRKVPAGIPKDHPYRVAALQENLLKTAIDDYMNKIVAEQRFVGIHLVLASQVVNNNTGVGPSLKAKIGHKILCGSNPSEQARKQAFSDASAVPDVPANVKTDSKASRGTGVAELEGHGACVFKSLFATTGDYAAALQSLRVPTTGRPAPTPQEIARLTPSLDDSSSPDGTPSGGGDQKRAPSVRNVSPEVLAKDAWDIDPETGERLHGFQRANAARHAATEGGKP